MAGFDPDEYGGYDGEDDELYAVENAYSEADRTSRPMKILLDVYKKYQSKDPIADRVAEDSEALQWLDDYWAYVCMVEHGNEASMEDVGGFVGFARSFSDYAPEIAEYLLYDDINEIDGDARGLYKRFIPIAQRYGGNVSKMKKSIEDEVFNNGEYLGDTYYGEPYRSRRSKYYKYNDKFYEFTEGTDQYGGLKEVTDFVMTHPRAGYEMYEEVRDNMPTKSTKKSLHDMIAQCRQNNNSLVKSRVDIHGKSTKKESISKMSWDDYKKLKRAYENGTVNSLINSMNNVIPGYGYQFESLFDECMSIGSLKSYIQMNYRPIDMPPLVQGHTSVYDSEGEEIVQFNFKGDGLQMMIRFTIRQNSDIHVYFVLWDGDQIVDEESQDYTDVSIDSIDQIFSDTDEIFRAIAQGYVNMVRRGI